MMRFVVRANLRAKLASVMASVLISTVVLFASATALTGCQERAPRSQSANQLRSPNGEDSKSSQGAEAYSGAKDVAQAADWSTRQPIQISKRAFNGALSALEFHSNYVAMNLPFLYMKPVYESLEQRVSTQLISRGESHVTVLTPPEEEALMRAGVTGPMADAIAARQNMQQSEITPICLGMGQARLDGKMERTYFIVVRAEHLRQIRQEVAKAQSTPNSDASRHAEFVAERFFPHVTVGFTRRDLFEQDGVIKDTASCIYPLEMLP